MKILTQEKITIKNNIRHLSLYRIAFLCISLAVWVLVPIVGIFPLLLSVQINLLQSEEKTRRISFVNNLILTFIVFTVCVFFTTHGVNLDIALYSKDYERLADINIFEAASAYGTGLEFVIYLFAYPVYYLTNGSVYAFLFNHALIINSLVVFVISKRLSKKYYPILLIFVLSSQFYYFQALVMRQALSNVFLMTAITTIESSGISFWLYSFLSVFSHFSNIVYNFIAMLIKITHVYNENNKINRNLLFFIFPVILLLLFQLYRTYGNVLGLENIFDIVQQRTDNYQGYNEENNYFTYPFVINSFIILLGFKLIPEKKVKLTTKTSLIIIFLLQIIALFLVSNIGFAWRIGYLLLSMYGFFNVFVIESKIIEIQYVKIIIYITMLFLFLIQFSVLLRQMSQGWVVGQQHIFFNGKPLEMSLFDYIIFFINATPNS
jgi:EpsG family